MGATVAVLGAPIRVQAVLSWPLRTWSYGDPARSANLHEVCREYFGRPYGELLREVEGSSVRIEPALLASLADRARERFIALRDRDIEIARSPRDAIGQLSTIVANEVR